MNISPINFRLNSINQRPNKNNFIQNSIQENSLAKVSLEQLKGMYNLTFKGVEGFGSKFLKKDEYGDTFFHKCNYDALELNKNQITPEILEVALLTQNKFGETPLFDIDDKRILLEFGEILGPKRASKVFSEAISKQNKQGKTILHCADNKTVEILYDFIGPKKAPKAFSSVLFILDNEGKTPIDYLDFKTAKLLVEIIAKDEKYRFVADEIRKKLDI